MPPFRFQKLGAIPYQRTGSELRVGAIFRTDSPPATYDDPAFFSQPVLMQGLSRPSAGDILSHSYSRTF